VRATVHRSTFCLLWRGSIVNNFLFPGHCESFVGKYSVSPIWLPSLSFTNPNSKLMIVEEFAFPVIIRFHECIISQEWIKAFHLLFTSLPSVQMMRCLGFLWFGSSHDELSSLKNWQRSRSIKTSLGWCMEVASISTRVTFSDFTVKLTSHQRSLSFGRFYPLRSESYSLWGNRAAITP
jgi:hypothetical protein